MFRLPCFACFLLSLLSSFIKGLHGRGVRNPHIAGSEHIEMYEAICECSPQYREHDDKRDCIRNLIFFAASINPARIAMLSSCANLSGNVSRNRNMRGIIVTAKSIILESMGDLESAGEMYERCIVRCHIKSHNKPISRTLCVKAM